MEDSCWDDKPAGARLGSPGEDGQRQKQTQIPCGDDKRENKGGKQENKGQSQCCDLSTAHRMKRDASVEMTRLCG
jgi:hypothetical protein